MYILMSLFAVFTGMNAEASTKKINYTILWLDDYYALSLNEYAISLNQFLPIHGLVPLW
jgi:hypothetical protein